MKKTLHDIFLSIAHTFVKFANCMNNENFKVVAISEDPDGGNSLVFGYAYDQQRGSLRVLYSKKLTDGFKRYLLENMK